MKTLKIFVLMLASAGLSLSSCQKNDSEIMTESVSKSLGVQLQAVNKGLDDWTASVASVAGSCTSSFSSDEKV